MLEDKPQGEGASILGNGKCFKQWSTKSEPLEVCIKDAQVVKWKEIPGGRAWSQNLQGHKKEEGTRVWYSPQPLERKSWLKTASPGTGLWISITIDQRSLHSWVNISQAEGQQERIVARP